MGVLTSHKHALLFMAMLPLLACQAPKPTQGGLARRTPAVDGKTSLLPKAIEGGALRPLAAGLRLQIQGSVRLISDHGGGIISNNSGGIISNHSGGIISNNSGGIISNNSGGILTPKLIGLHANAGMRLRLAQAESAATESLLAHALVQFFDAADRPLANAQGQPLEATTNAQGQYQLDALLPPNEPVVARIALFNGGQLKAMVVPEQQASGSFQAPVDTATSLGAAYVLDRLVKGQVSLYQRLPAAESLALNQAAEKARQRLGQLKPSYLGPEMLALAEDLKSKDAAFSAQLDRIEALLLAGQKDRGDGLLATQVSISRPVALWARPQAGQGFVVYEAVEGRRRVVGADGRVQSMPFSAIERPSPTMLHTGVATADGGMLVVDGHGGRVLKLEAESGELKRVAGLGTRGQEGLGGPALQAQLLNPISAAQAKDGSIWIGEEAFGVVGGSAPSRLLKVDPQGMLQSVPLPASIQSLALSDKLAVSCLVALPDGSMLAAFSLTGAHSNALVGTSLWRWKDGAWNTQALWKGLLKPGLSASHLVQADGSVLFVASFQNQIWRWREGSTQPEVVAGEGQADYAGDGGPVRMARFSAPKALAPLPEGGYLVADTGNGLVRRVDAQGTIRTVAGTRGLVATGDALSVALNGPGTPVLGPNGSLWVPEFFSGTIKSLSGGQLTAVAGAAPGYRGDGGPALSAQFDGISALARDPKSGTVYLTDAFNYRIRSIDATGNVHAVAGNGDRNSDGVREQAASGAVPVHELYVLNPLSVAVDAQSRPWFSDGEAGLVWRLDPDGKARLMGGDPNTTGGVAGALSLSKSMLSMPAALALGLDGRMLLAETAGMRLWKEKSDASGLEPWAGGGFAQAIARASEGRLQDPDGTPLAEACFITPISLAVAKDGTIAVGEMGTTKLESLAAFLPIPIFPDIIAKLGPRIRLIRPDGTVDTLAGEGGRVLAAQEGDDALGAPWGMAFDNEERLVVADVARNQLKLIPKAAWKVWR